MYKWNILGSFDDKKDVSVSILENRGVKNPKEFLDAPSLKEAFEDLPHGFKRSLLKAKDVVFKWMEKEMPILIFGDYDSDGINATAILYNFFKYEKMYSNISYLIPNRFEHSYGLSKEAVDESLKAFDDNVKVLFITVDVGITAEKEISYIKKMGHSLIL